MEKTNIVKSAEQSASKKENPKYDSDVIIPQAAESENKAKSENAPLFSTSNGKKLTKRALQKIITEIMEKANCKASAHTLRHTFATAHYNDHKKLVELSTLLGHSSLNTTARYTQASHDDLALQLEESSLNEF